MDREKYETYISLIKNELVPALAVQSRLQLFTQRQKPRKFWAKARKS